jgi:cytochrome c-type biogenesis protein CcmH
VTPVDAAPVRRTRGAARRALAVVVLLCTGLGGPAFGAEGAPAPAAPAPAASPAPQARPLADDPALEDAMLRIANDLRCLVCQNETIAASHADLAVDLRNQIRQQLRAGRTEAQIKEYMVDRYGDFVLYRPPMKPLTWALWIGPFVLLAAMLVWYVRLLRRRARVAPPPMDDAQRARARALLEGADPAAGAGGRPAGKPRTVR